MAAKPDKPLTNVERVEILQVQENSTNQYLQDLEVKHFGDNRNTTLRAKFETVIALADSFRESYDDYLLYLWDQQQAAEINISSGSLITSVPVLTYAEDIS